MPTPSNWTLTPGAVRFFVPHFLQHQLALHPLTNGLYLNGCGYYPSARGHQMRRLDHEDNLLLYCTAGRGWLSFFDPRDDDVRRHDIHAGDAVVIPKGISHHYEADQDNPWTIYWAHFDGLLGAQHCEHILSNAQYNVVHSGVSQALIASFEQLFIAQNTGYHLPIFINACHTLGVLLTNIAISSTSWTGKHAYPQLETITTHMKNVIDGSIELDTLAQLAGLSKFHFIKKYKATFGYTPIQHFIHLKIERACFLLDTTALTVSEVAEKLGYDDPHYFSRLFRKITGLSPTHYRHLQRG